MDWYQHPARWQQPAEDGKVDCLLCPRNCRIGPGRSGYCGVRINRDGMLFSIAYGYPVSVANDPIEKKPLAEFMPGTRTFSLGTFGCNLGCSFCQNHELSTGRYQEAMRIPYAEPERIVMLARQQRCASVAFTYNEPTIFAEYVIDTAQLAHRDRLATVLVSNGYITREAAADLYPHIDAANIDMKGFSEDFYREMCGASLPPVLDSMKYFYQLGKHLEITNLVIPGKNDDPAMVNAFLDWMEKELSKEVPIHFSAYHPDHKYHDSPPTGAETLLTIRKIANDRGFQHVYLGNIRLPQ